MTRTRAVQRTARLLAKHAAAEVIARSGAVRLPMAGRRVLVLSFHRVVEDFQAERARSLPALLIGARTLRQLLEVVARHWDVVSLPVAAREMAGPARTGPRLAAITFDDGYRDVYQQAFPVLQALRMPATVYLPTDFVSGTGVLLHDQLYSLLVAFRERRLEPGCLPAAGARILVAGIDAAGTGPHPLTDHLCAATSRTDLQILIDALAGRIGPVSVSGAPMTWAMARALAHTGWEIGAHTVRHIVLPREPQSVMRQELLASRAEVEAHTGWPCRHFAYPNGAYSLASQRALREIGFESAVTTEDRPQRPAGEDPLALPRKALWEQSCLGADGRFSETVTLCNLAGAFAWLGLARHVPGRVPDALDVPGSGTLG